LDKKAAAADGLRRLSLSEHASTWSLGQQQRQQQLRSDDEKSQMIRYLLPFYSRHVSTT
jgi:hypothetical protein